MGSNAQRNILLILILFPVLSSSCFNKRAEIQRGYYFWRTNHTTPVERKFVKNHKLRKIYARIMDVDWSEVHGPIPVSPRHAETLKYELLVNDSVNIEVIPVVFITNKTFQNIDDEGIELLAKRLIRRCLPAYDSIDIKYEERHKLWRYKGPLRPKEIQFDCDWTATTSKKYFQFLSQVKWLLPSDSILISATIRLHQYAYPSKTGVPPVSRGMLMMYNISDPKKYDAVNSIFDRQAASGYFRSADKYPLPLDIALPAWSWCIIFRNKKFYQIENDLDETALKELSFLTLKQNGFYQVNTDTVYRNLFLRPGDEIKAEGIDEFTLEEAANLAEKAINSKDVTVSLFELSEHEIKNYSSECIDKVYNSFH